MDVALKLDYFRNQILGLDKFPDLDFVLEVFAFQAQSNPVYKEYLNLLGVTSGDITRLEEIPFLPISFFKNHSIKTGTWPAEQVFSSSGTTSNQTSKHELFSSSFYRAHSQRCFEERYGSLADYCVLALLPNYLERGGSSLVFMVDHFIRTSKDQDSGFFLYDWAQLAELLKRKIATGQKTLLIGVSFALLDFAEQFDLDLSDIVIMETGGMKGRRKEIPRAALHRQLQTGFKCSKIHSEYGMTELLSQAYSTGDGLFKPPPSMQVFAGDITDPFSYVKAGKTGVLRLIDLANFASISFIETADLIQQSSEGFYVLGRMDNALMRGCNLMYESA